MMQLLLAVSWSAIGTALACVLVALVAAVLVWAAFALLEFLGPITKTRQQALVDLREAEFLIRGATANLPNARQALIDAQHIQSKRAERYAEYSKELDIHEERMAVHGSLWPSYSLARIRTYLENLDPAQMPEQLVLERLAECLEGANSIADLESAIRKENDELAELDA